MNEKRRSGGEAKTDENKSAVCLKGVKFAYKKGEQAVLDIPFFAVERGDRVFIYGASGGGKSTLLSLIAGVLQPQEGEIEVDGVCLNDFSGAKRDSFRGDRIGYIFQQFNLIPYLSVIDNALIPCRLSRIRRERAKESFGDIREAAKNLLSRLDLAPDLWDRQAARLSVGQQQRVAAARALIGSPPILVADEPTSSLDEQRREYFLKLLLQAREESGSTLIFVSHDRDLAKNFNRAEALNELNRATPQKERV
ncbi:MAG: ABC transporter ATP-binding protein [Helicobacteraceae bacterium]|jgi:putative ABC transport system ATP-binding protein|nr:ABC transporter ATP-binding protein [Helicobacteraceae bacterium]